jgi:hypothetical protein
MFFPSDFDALPRTPRPNFPRVVRVTRPVLDLTRRDLVASANGRAGAIHRRDQEQGASHKVEECQEAEQQHARQGCGNSWMDIVDCHPEVTRLLEFTRLICPSNSIPIENHQLHPRGVKGVDTLDPANVVVRHVQLGHPIADAHRRPRAATEPPAKIISHIDP